MELLEIIADWETPNIYKVYPGDAEGKRMKFHPDGSKAKALFKCKEKSTCCQR